MAICYTKPKIAANIIKKRWVPSYGNRFIRARIQPALSEKLSDFVNRVGATKSEVFTAALVQYLGATEDLPLSSADGGVREADDRARS